MSYTPPQKKKLKENRNFKIQGCVISLSFAPEMWKINQKISSLRISKVHVKRNHPIPLYIFSITDAYFREHGGQVCESYFLKSTNISVLIKLDHCSCYAQVISSL